MFAFCDLHVLFSTATYVPSTACIQFTLFYMFALASVSSFCI